MVARLPLRVAFMGAKHSRLQTLPQAIPGLDLNELLGGHFSSTLSIHTGTPGLPKYGIFGPPGPGQKRCYWHCTKNVRGLKWHHR